MKYMHNIQEDNFIGYNIPPYWVPEGTLHNLPSTGVSQQVCLHCCFKIEQKESWEQPRADHTSTLASWPCRDLPGNLQTLLQQVFLSMATAIQNRLPVTWATCAPEHTSQTWPQAELSSLASQCMPCSAGKAGAIKYLTYWMRALPAKGNSN